MKSREVAGGLPHLLIIIIHVLLRQTDRRPRLVVLRAVVARPVGADRLHRYHPRLAHV